MIGTRSHSILVRNASWRTRLETLLADHPADASPERWHQIREALGRLAVWLRLADQEDLRQSVKRLHRAVGRLRDLDVVEETVSEDKGASGEQRAEERRRRESALLAQLRTARVATLLQRLRGVPPLNYETAAARCRDLARRTLKAGRRFVREPSLSAAHRLRRRLRELRFAREWLKWKTGPLRPLVRKLGSLHDRSLVAADRHADEADRKDSAEFERALGRCRTQWKDLRRQIRRWS